MKNHCRELVGFSFRAAFGFGSDFLCAKFSGIYNLTFLSFPLSSVITLLAFLS